MILPAQRIFNAVIFPTISLEVFNMQHQHEFVTARSSRSELYILTYDPKLPLKGALKIEPALRKY